MIGVYSGVIILFGLLLTAADSREERLWCYECNTDLRHGHKGDCNDPYTPGAFDLVACPQNESHHCHKNKSILVTARACVSSRQIGDYCNYEDRFPHSSIECYFCKENNCNGKVPLKPIPEWSLVLLAFVSWMLT